jgi:hypothetical protein
MAEEQSNGAGLAPASESIHLPGPTYLPVLVAAFTTIALVGVVVNYVMAGIGAAVVLFCIVRWIRDVRRDIADLPLEH